MSYRCYPWWGALVKKKGWDKTKKSRLQLVTGILKKGHQHTLPPAERAVPSAQVGLTSLFEMVRGGPNRHRHRKSYN